MKILLATDGSEYSEGAAKFLTNLQFSSDDELTVLHVISWVAFRDDVESYHASLKHIKQEIAPKILDSAVDILKPVNAKISTALLEGDSRNSIIDVAINSDADLIVMGARGLKGIKSLMVGSVTRSVAVNSPIPVLVIKPSQFEPPGKLKILFATDGSEYADATGKFLASMPFPDKSEVTVLNVIWSALSDIPERFFIETDDRIKETVARVRTTEFSESEKVLQSARESLREKFPGVKVLTKVGDPSTEILAAAEASNTDIIVVGCRGLRGVKGMVGSVSRNILRHSTCSVLIGKPCG
ncbi:MAG: universal stress protein [Nitrospirota bacterium]